MKNHFLLILLSCVSFVLSAQDDCFRINSDSIVVNSGSWGDCKKACGGPSSYNSYEKIPACFFGYQKIRGDYFKEWYNKFVENKSTYPIRDYEKNYCMFLQSSVDSAFEQDDFSIVKNDLNELFAALLFWDKYRDFIFFCESNVDISTWQDEAIRSFFAAPRNRMVIDGEKIGQPSLVAENLFGIKQSKQFEGWSKKELFWSFMFSEKRSYFEKLGEKLDAEYNRINKEHEKIGKESDLKSDYYTGSVRKKNFILTTNAITDIGLDEYIKYLNKLKEDMKILSPKWITTIDKEIQIHKQIHNDCKGIMQGFVSSDAVRKGLTYLKEVCNEKTLLEKDYSLFQDSLENSYWETARIYELYGNYLKDFPAGKHKVDAERKLQELFLPIPDFIKKIERQYENGYSLVEIIRNIREYQEIYKKEDDVKLNECVKKYQSIMDSVAVLYKNWTYNYHQGRDILPNCYFKTSSNSYSVEMNDLSKLPEKNGSLSCYYPLFSYTGERMRPLYDEDYDVEDVFSVVNLEATIKNKKISSGIEYGFDPVEYKLNYNSSYENGKKKGYFKLNNLIEINYNNENYVIEFLDDEDKEMTLLDVQNMFYLLGKNTRKLKHLSPNSLLDEEGKEKISFTKGKITAVSSVSKNRKITLPLNNQGEINGIIKYWDSNVGEVEMSVQANKPRVDDKGNTKISKVKIRGCTFTPPRKIIGYEKHKWGKSAIYEKFSKQCESVADEVGMNILLEPMISHTYTYSAFIPVFLVDILDWNNIK